MRLLIFFFLLLSKLALAQNLVPGAGSFMYKSYAPLSSKPIRVYYFIPAGNIQTMKVLFALHGEERDGKDYLDDWTDMANQNKFMVFAPEFPDSSFKGGDGYILANIFVDGDNPTPGTLNKDSHWTFSLMDPLFNYVRQQTGTNASGYVAFGHSAGAQFLHRFLLYKPNNLMEQAICANAGWYTMPNASVDFPYGTKKSPSSDSLVKAALARKMLVLLGKLDIDPNSPNLRHNPQVDIQGLNRLQRGRYFYTNSRNIATAFNTTFNWTLAEVAGVAHDHTLMARNALPFVLNAFTDVQKTFIQKPEMFISANEIRLKGLEASEKYRLSLLTLDGKKLFSWKDLSGKEIELPLPKKTSGLYFLLLETSDGGRFIKRFISL